MKFGAKVRTTDVSDCIPDNIPCKPVIPPYA